MKYHQQVSCTSSICPQQLCIYIYIYRFSLCYQQIIIVIHSRQINVQMLKLDNLFLLCPKNVKIIFKMLICVVNSTIRSMKHGCVPGTPHLLSYQQHLFCRSLYYSLKTFIIYYMFPSFQQWVIFHSSRGPHQILYNLSLNKS